MSRPDNKAGSPLLEVRNLSLSFSGQQQLAIDDVSFKLMPGRTLGLVGSSGAGKSSIARAIMLLEKPLSGDILFRGESLYQMSKTQLMSARQNVQLVFQNPSASLSPRRSIGQTLLEPLNHFAIGNANDRQEKIHNILHTVGLDHDVLTRYPHQFSSGQQQRIAIARALVTDPKLLIADEAVSALDVSVQAQILQLIQSLQQDLGIALLFISHDLAVVQQIADEVAVMYRGQLLEQCPSGVFFDKPAHPYSNALLSFADNRSDNNINIDEWQLNRGREKTGQLSRCLFIDNCRDNIPICQQLEPANHLVQHENLHAVSPHCVKCHLYDGAITNEGIKAPE